MLKFVVDEGVLAGYRRRFHNRLPKCNGRTRAFPKFAELGFLQIVKGRQNLARFADSCSMPALAHTKEFQKRFNIRFIRKDINRIDIRRTQHARFLLRFL